MFILGCDKVHNGLEAVKVDGVYRISRSDEERSPVLIGSPSSFLFFSIVYELQGRGGLE